MRRRGGCGSAVRWIYGTTTPASSIGSVRTATDVPTRPTRIVVGSSGKINQPAPPSESNALDNVQSNTPGSGCQTAPTGRTHDRTAALVRPSVPEQARELLLNGQSFGFDNDGLLAVAVPLMSALMAGPFESSVEVLGAVGAVPATRDDVAVITHGLAPYRFYDCSIAHDYNRCKGLEQPVSEDLRALLAARGGGDVTE